jgi:hypothetical protein
MKIAILATALVLAAVFQSGPGGGAETVEPREGVIRLWNGMDLRPCHTWLSSTEYEDPGRAFRVTHEGLLQAYVNGTLVNGAFDVSPAAGRLQLQTDLAERFVRRWELWSAGRGPQPAPAEVPATPDRRRPKLLSKELFLRHDRGRPVATGFVTYVSDTQPVLMHCFGREDYSDGYDDYAISLSRDNGRTWSQPTVRWRSEVRSGGRLRYAEPAAYYDQEKQKLIVLIDRTFYPNDQLNVDADYGLELNIYDPQAGFWIEQRALEFPRDRTPAMSFSFPLKTSRGNLLFPGMRKVIGPDGKALHFKNCWAPVDEAVTVIGRWNDHGGIEWQLGQPLTVAPEISSRGLDENAIFELPDGRIAAVCRGDNSMFPDRPGYKWLSFSHDDGRSWSAAVPLPANEGEPLESGANGSALFRSIKNGRLYWMGNLALSGERPRGNFPRSPLVLVEVDDRSMALKRETIYAIDERNFNDSSRVQMSNFRFYQDRENGDLVVFLSRYGEFSEKEWMLADYYRYRIELP